MTVLEGLGAGVAALLTVNFALNLRSSELKTAYRALRTIRGWRALGAVLQAAAVLFMVVALGLSLIAVWPHVMGFSWLRLLATPAEAPAAGTNLMTSGLRVPGFAWVFWLLLVANVPRLAKNEERAFRQGHRKLGPVLWQSVKFGLAHCLVGVPVGIGLAMTISGLWMAWHYLRGGVRRATAYHAVHNWFVLATGALWMAGWI